MQREGKDVNMVRYQCPKEKQVRVIVDSDAKNEADDQFAIVHALLTPKFHVKGVIAAHFGTGISSNSMEESYEECLRLRDCLGMDVPVVRGAHGAIGSREVYEYSPGAQLIVREALADDPRPLYVLFMGPITDMACALLEHPEIAPRVTAVWNGGAPYPHGGLEFNLSNDILAANVVMESSMDLWQIPADQVSKMAVGLAELEYKVRPCGKLGEYLFEQLADFNNSPKAHWTTGESWCLGDSCTVGALLYHDPVYLMQEAPAINPDMTYRLHTGYRPVRVFRQMDSRFVLEDFFSKLALYGKAAD